MRPATPDTPRDEQCNEVNPALWDYFGQQLNHYAPNPKLWTEADVVRMLDQLEIVAQTVEDITNRMMRLFSPTSVH